jgi:hypothetical protein
MMPATDRLPSRRPYARRPIKEKPKPRELTYTAIPQPDGTVRVRSNMSIME